MIVAPATARLIGEYAAGISSGVLTATLLATAAPVLVCPAMHTEMWRHPAVQENLTVLRGAACTSSSPSPAASPAVTSGRAASPSPPTILDAATALLCGAESPLAGCASSSSAGGTREAIDPVRYLSNRSSGKQGYALAEEAAARRRRGRPRLDDGAPACPGIAIRPVESAEGSAARCSPSPRGPTS